MSEERGALCPRCNTGVTDDDLLAGYTTAEWLRLLGDDPRRITHNPLVTAFEVVHDGHTHVIHPRVVWSFVMAAVLGVKVRPLYTTKFTLTGEVRKPIGRPRSPSPTPAEE